MNTATVDVRLGERSYTIQVGRGLLRSAQSADLLAAQARGGQVVLVTHPLLLRLYGTALLCILERHGVRALPATVPSGERTKSLAAVARLYDRFLNAGMDRRGLVVALGGGVVGDLAGFAAATYLRGVRYVQIPTTLLAQVDSSVGGKTGVDLARGKNLVGAFHQPSAVLIDPETLRTLPPRELRAGLAEVLKYGVLADADFFNKTVGAIPELLSRKAEALTAAIVRSCEIKADIVAQDESEQGLRATLNYGHTIGHALETVTAYRRYKHGEAVAIGMVSAALIGEAAGVTPRAVSDTLVFALEKAGLPVRFPGDVSPSAVLAAAYRDKKATGGRLRFVLAEEIGRVRFGVEVSPELVEAALVRQQALP